MNIKSNERVLIAGKTGSGKTWLARSLLSAVPRLVVIDAKANLTDWGLKQPTGRDWAALARGDQGRFRVLLPIVDDLQAWSETLFQQLYNIGDLTIYIDEAYSIVPPGARPGAWLSALYTRGREFGIGVWASTQRPAWIPLFLASESDWMMIFRLNLKEDRQRLASVAGPQVIEPIPDPHGFYLYHVGDENPQYFRKAVLKP